MATAVETGETAQRSTGLQRRIGFWGLTFISLGSIIGSGWLLGALTAAQTAGGGGSLVSWVLAAVMLGVLALIHADLGAAYPVAGGTTRYPHYAFGGFAGFTAGWTTYIQCVAIAPLEVSASIDYVNAIPAVKQHFDMVQADGQLNALGLVVAVLALLLFTFINAMGATWLSDSNTGIVIWKVAVPLLTVVVLLIVIFQPRNFTAGGGFAPDGFHGIFAALPAGVVFALQGFEQAAQVAGEAKDPRKHMAKAIITAMGIGAVVYILLEIAFVGAVPSARVAQNWHHPLPVGDYGPYYTLAVGAGITWLSIVLIIDAVVSPGGTGLIYIGTSSRISYALGMPSWMRRTTKRGVPIWSVLVAAGFGLIALAPTPSWRQLVEVITSSTALMYAFAPISLWVLNRSDPDRDHPYRAPAQRVLLPVGFVFANLIAYWGGFDTVWKLAVFILIGQVIYLIAGRMHAKSVETRRPGFRSAIWIWVWLAGLVLLDWLGQYGPRAAKVIPGGWDEVAVAAFALVVFAWAVRNGQERADAEALVEEDRKDDALQLD
ncbi:MAG TPA: APC family permease [Amnibacterium sp.]|nr:APC family permease [Amnibacterium sp.]